MRLLNTHTGQFVEKDPEEEDIYGDPKTIYAILSHTWDKGGEQTYKELKKIQRRYGPKSQVSQNPPTRRSENVTSSSTGQVQDEPSPMLPSSQLQSDSVSETAPLITRLKCSKSWFTGRIARLKRLCQCRSARRNTEPGSSEATVRTPVDAPSPDDPPAPPANDPHGAASSDPSAPSPGDSPPQTTRLPTALGRFTQSEVEALFRVFVEPELYGLPDRNPPSAPSAEHQPPSPPRSVLDDPGLSPKIRDACRVARENDYDYIWIDSCCIDKSSSSELSEAINSMYKWYRLARVCYTYLADVPPGEDHCAERSCFRKSRWFTRGWTLQELIAPARVEFLAQDWSPIGSKRALVDLVESITKIHYKGLLHLEPLDTFSVAQRLSWAANRETTREEDRAYSLLGIFGIHMPTLYGEGDRAFRRLQEEIMQRIPDQSLFAWGDIYLPGSPLSKHGATGMFGWVSWAQAARWSINQSRSLFVQSPYGFKNSGSIRHVQLPPSHRYEIEYTLTPLGIRTRFQMIPFTHDLLSSMFPLYSDIKLRPSNNTRYLAILGCEHDQHPGHFLGRLCYTSPSESNVESPHTGPVLFSSKTRHHDEGDLPDLFPLSPEAIEHCRPHIELKTVYIPLPQSDHAYPNPLESLRMQPYAAITLVMLKGTRDALRSRGYSADLQVRDPTPDPDSDSDSDHPATHWLTLSNGEHTVTVEFHDILGYDGKHFTVISGVRDSAQRDRGTVYYWQDHCPWVEGFAPKSGFTLSTAEAELLSVDLDLQFLGHGFYSIVVDVSSDAPPQAPPDMVESAPPGVPSAGSVDSSDPAQCGPFGHGDGPPSGVINAEDDDSEAGQEEAGGSGTASAKARDGRDSAGDGAARRSEEVGGGST